jgi:2-dehydropantoate 2-reductase
MLLAKTGADVTFLVRPARAQQLDRDGLMANSRGEKLRQPVRRIQVGQVDAPLDLILLACGAYDLAPAMEAIAPAVGATTWCCRC